MLTLVLIASVLGDLGPQTRIWGSDQNPEAFLEGRAQLSAEGAWEKTAPTYDFAPGPRKQLDEETGLTYFGARYYDSKRARWISPDPAMLEIVEDGQPIGLSTYAYTFHNPLNLVDPDGRQPRPPIRINLRPRTPTGRRVAGPAEAPITQRIFEISWGVSPRPRVASMPAEARAQHEAARQTAREARATLEREGASLSPEQRQVLKGLVRAGERGVRANAAQGKEFEDRVARQMEAEGWNVAREVTLETPSGGRTRMDIVGTRGSAVRCVECKSSADVSALTTL